MDRLFYEKNSNLKLCKVEFYLGSQEAKYLKKSKVRKSN